METNLFRSDLHFWNDGFPSEEDDHLDAHITQCHIERQAGEGPESAPAGCGRCGYTSNSMRGGRRCELGHQGSYRGFLATSGFLTRNFRLLHVFQMSWGNSWDWCATLVCKIATRQNPGPYSEINSWCCLFFCLLHSWINLQCNFVSRQLSCEQLRQKLWQRRNFVRPSTTKRSALTRHSPGEFPSNVRRCELCSKVLGLLCRLIFARVNKPSIYFWLYSS